MKTGRVAKLFDKDQNTIVDWTRRFSEFFSPTARGEGRSQRDFTPEDLVVVNTIRVGRDLDGMDWDEIQQKLRNGILETETMPAAALAITGTEAMQIHGINKALQTEVMQLRVLLAAKDEELRAERELRWKTEGELREQVGKWRALAELYEKLWKDERDSE